MAAAGRRGLLVAVPFLAVAVAALLLGLDTLGHAETQVSATLFRMESHHFHIEKP